MTSAFDPETFAAATTEDALDTHYTPCPEGEWLAVIDSIDPRNPKEGMFILDVRWAVDVSQFPPTMQEAFSDLDTINVKQGVFLDYNETNGLANGPNRNVALGRLRDAVGQNVRGQAWSPSRLVGAGPAYVTVRHDIDGENTYDRVVRVAKA